MAITALSGEIPPAELVSEFKVHSTMISTCKQELMKYARELFVRGKADHPMVSLKGSTVCSRSMAMPGSDAWSPRPPTAQSNWRSAGRNCPRLHGRSAWIGKRGHTRRKFYDIPVAAQSPLAAEALRQIAALYATEADICGQSADQRRLARQKQTRPLIAAMHDWLHKQFGHTSGHSALAQAIRYALNHWAGLILFLDDGRIELDTNTVEQALRPVALAPNGTNYQACCHRSGSKRCSAPTPVLILPCVDTGRFGIFPDPRQQAR